MIKPKVTCLDIILISAFAYAIADMVKNWSVYSSIAKPLNIYIITSLFTLIIFRCTHYFG